MDNKILENEFLNIDLYNNIINKLKNIPENDASAQKIRQELSLDMNNTLNKMGNVTAVIAAYYYYSLGKKELEFLMGYYRKTFATYFNSDSINKFYNNIITNDFLSKAIYDITGMKLTKKENPKNKYGKTTRVITLSKKQYENFKDNANLLKMIEKNGSKKYSSNNFCDKIATSPRSLVEKIVDKVNRYKNLSVTSINKPLLNDVSKSLSSIYNNYERMLSKDKRIKLNDLKNKKIIAISGTKVTTINEKNKIKLV